MAEENTKAVSDEQIIAALMNGGTVATAAKLLGISPRTIYNRMRVSAFKVEYMEAKSDVLRNAVNELSGKTSQAVQTIVDVMQNEENPPTVRLQAAQAILNQAQKFSERLTESEAIIASKSKWLGTPFDI